MIILEQELKKVIREEAKRILLERELKSFIVSKLTEAQKKEFLETGTVPDELVEGVLNWLRTKGRKLAGAAALSAALMGPLASVAQAATPSTPEIQAPADTGNALQNVYRAEKQVKAALLKWYSSDLPANAFVKFTRNLGSPSFVNKSDEDIKDYYETEVALKILDVLESTKILNTKDDIEKIPSSVIEKFKDVQIGGLYDPNTNAIYMNPDSFEATGESDIDTIMTTMEEEFFHAIDSNVRVGDVFPSLAGKPQADVQFAMSKALGRSDMADIIVSDNESGLGSDYKYLTNPQEFWAKLRVIKNKLPQNFFDAQGSVDANKLRDLIENPGRYFKRGQIDFRILRLLDKNKIDKIGNYFDQLAQVDTNISSQKA